MRSVALDPLEGTALSDAAFLRERCRDLQRALTIGGAAPDRAELEAFDGRVLARWTVLLVPPDPWPPATALVLEELYVLQARIVERLARGGVADISKHVECLVRAMLVDKLQRLTEEAVEAIA